MSCNNESCPCKQSKAQPFYCHFEDTPYSYEYQVPHGHEGHVRVFDMPDTICGIGIEQALTGGGSAVYRDANGKCRIVCAKTRTEWFSFKDINCCQNTEEGGLTVKPWLLTPNFDCEIVLPPGCFRFVAYDADYSVITPGPNDIKMLLNIEAC